MSLNNKKIWLLALLYFAISFTFAAADTGASALNNIKTDINTGISTGEWVLIGCGVLAFVAAGLVIYFSGDLMQGIKRAAPILIALAFILYGIYLVHDRSKLQKIAINLNTQHHEQTYYS